MLINSVINIKGAAKAYSLACFKRLVSGSSYGYGNIPFAGGERRRCRHTGKIFCGGSAENHRIIAESDFGKGV